MADPPRNGLTPAERAKLIKAMERGGTEYKKRLLEHVAGALSVEPDWQTLATKSPDRWAQALHLVSKQAGVYTEKVELSGTVNLRAYAAQLEDMSDAEVYAEHARVVQAPAKVLKITPLASGARAEGA